MAISTFNIGSMIKTGWESVGNLTQSLATKSVQAGYNLGLSFFPAAQKTTVTPSVVSKQPYTTYQGYPQIVKQATTLTDTFKSWFNNSMAFGGYLLEAPYRLASQIGSAAGQKTVANSVSLWDQLKSGYVQAKTAAPVQTAAQSALKYGSELISITAKKTMELLPDYFMEKWGLINRADSGERTNPVTNAQPVVIINQDPTQSSAPGTVSSLADFLGLLQLGSQPQGAYSIGFPQQEPIPTSSIAVPSSGSSVMPIALIAGAAVVGFILLKKFAHK